MKVAGPVRYKGKVTTWNSARGFGYVTPAGGGERIFVHITAIADRTRPPAEGDIVTYDLTLDERKRPRATRVKKSTPISPSSQKARASTSNVAPLTVCSLFLLIVATGTLAGRLPPVIIGIYCIVSIVTSLLYWLDKSAARRGAWRMQERSLLFIGLVGGWPGAVVAQRVLRHKTRKQSFQLAFWGTAVLNSIVLGWLLTDSGSSFAKRILE
jgi:uncharacterized membrane protein YsdA (DUF1294 family)/cold shock CspA family protein